MNDKFNALTLTSLSYKKGTGHKGRDFVLAVIYTRDLKAQQGRDCTILSPLD